MVELALQGGKLVACAVSLQGAGTLYGRYWGAAGEHHSLHFELCYYRGIEHCIRTGLARFEPGTQGEHKIARGYEPVVTRSAHFLPNPGFRDAVAHFLDGERAAVDREIEWLRSALPYSSAA